ncbi:MAG: arylsulfatase [Planctomycetota bacterium]
MVYCRNYLPSLACLLMIACLPDELSAAFENDRPNVIVFLSDDQGYGDFSSTGNLDLQTPNIDSLAQDGAFFESFYVCPVCSPTRAEFLTGRYSARCGVYSTSAGGERLDLDESTIAQAFQSAGYATAAFGKWHNGMQGPFHPNARGFDEFYGFCSGHWGHYFSPMLERNGNIVRGNGYCVDDFTDHAIQFIEDHQRDPFFVYLPYNTPHSPMQVPEQNWNRFKDKTLTSLPPDATNEKNKRKGKGIQHCRAALAMCENIDQNVGRILNKIEDLHLVQNTIVLYFCDNGPNGPRYNAGLKGRKGSTDEGGVRSPLYLRWPARVKPGARFHQVTGAIDLYPTLAEICQVKPTPTKPFDGISMAGLLLGDESSGLDDRHLMTYWKGKSSVRWKNYRLDHQHRLFNLIDDPGQTQPIVNKTKIRNQLIGYDDEFRQTVVPELDPDTVRVFPIGHPVMNLTQLPARDGVATGKLKRSNRFPNCSYFLNWVDRNDSIQWPVEIVESGTFQVKLYYCLDLENAGAEVELSFGNSRLVKTINQPHISPLIGAAEDRSVRGESLVKNFKPIVMGEIELTQGTGPMVLRTLKMPGDESIEFRLLLFERILK